MIARLRRGIRDDSGFGLILVIGTMGVISVMIATTSIIAVSSLRAAQSRVANEQALGAAENGIDFTLARLQKAFDDYNADYPIPSTPNAFEPSPACNGTSVNDPGTFSTAAAETAWVQTQLSSLLASHPECVQTGGQGDYLVLKPTTPLVNGQYPKYGRIYSVGWSPRQGAANSVVRVLKTEYVFMPFRPTHAVLTGGDLKIDSSTTVQAAFGIDPAVASVHTNGTITSVLGNPTVTGPVTSTGSSSASSNNFNANPGGSVSQKNIQRLPRVSARSLYFHAGSVQPPVTTDWYDLCSDDGTVRTYSPSGPCQSTDIIGTASTSTAVRGWTYTSGSRTWIASKNAEPSTYYVDEGNVDVGPGNGTIANITVIASSQNPDNCASKKYGNIIWDHFAIDAPAYPNLFFYADADLATGANFSAGHGTTSPPVTSGMFVAGDQIELETSSSGAVGSVLAGDACTTSTLVTLNEVKNPTIWYDPNSDAPFTSVINTTLWLEFPGIRP